MFQINGIISIIYSLVGVFENLIKDVSALKAYSFL